MKTPCNIALVWLCSTCFRGIHKDHTNLDWMRWDSGTLIGLLKDLDYIEKPTVSDIMPDRHFDLMVSATL
jgi:hypothetical protein